MKTLKIYWAVLTAVLLPAWAAAQEAPRVLEDRNGYFLLEDLSVRWTGNQLKTEDSDQVSLAV